jgi:hypothetical protein
VSIGKTGQRSMTERGCSRSKMPIAASASIFEKATESAGRTGA